MAAKERLVIKSNGQRYVGWKSVRVSHSLEMGASEISLEVAEWPDNIGLYLEAFAGTLVITFSDRAEQGDALVVAQNVVSRSRSFSVAKRLQSYTAKSMTTVKAPGKSAVEVPSTSLPGQTDTVTPAGPAETSLVPVSVTTLDPAIHRLGPCWSPQSAT